MGKRKQLISSDEARPAKSQHVKPCSDCPFARKALAGWLGGQSAEDWVQAAHGESHSECHVHTGVQCAGMAIYRTNVAKKPRDKTILVLPSDRERVFSSPQEFLAHHSRKDKL